MKRDLLVGMNVDELDTRVGERVERTLIQIACSRS
jgi:hypothetical protein